MPRTRNSSTRSPRRSGPLRTTGGATLAVALLFFLPSMALATSPGVPAASLALNGSGTLSVTLTVVDPNGSALRSAIDGNFTPLVDALPVNASDRTKILAEIQTFEATSYGRLFFGSHQGYVTPAEVALFESLLVSTTSSPFPSLSVGVAGAIAVTLDGALPTFAQLQSIDLEGAPGPDASPAPITIVAGWIDTFPEAGSVHTLTLTTNLSAAGLPLVTLGPVLALSFSTPAGMRIDHTSGLEAASVANDLLGWSPSSVAGTFAPAVDPTATIVFGHAFPLGYVLVGAGVLAAGFAAGVVVLRRQRAKRAARARATADAPEEPSGSG